MPAAPKAYHEEPAGCRIPRPNCRVLGADFAAARADPNMSPSSRSAFLAALEGAYPAERAAALSGVPKSTVYDWARKELVRPSVSATREKLWSYADLMLLRVVYWLRQRKGSTVVDVPATSMTHVRKVLKQAEESDLALWHLDDQRRPRSRVFVDLAGDVFLDHGKSLADLRGQGVLDAEYLDLLGPFAADGARGPDLRAPRESIRIVPGKLAGEPHLVHSRISTLAIAGLADQGYPLDQIHRLYPQATACSLEEAIDLEKELRRHVQEAA